jgi:hypothetical protein
MTLDGRGFRDLGEVPQLRQINLQENERNPNDSGGVRPRRARITRGESPR